MNVDALRNVNYVLSESKPGVELLLHFPCVTSGEIRCAVRGTGYQSEWSEESCFEIIRKNAAGE